MSDYPQHEKVKANKAKCDAVGEFLEWLTEQGYQLARPHEHDENCWHTPPGRRAFTYLVCEARKGELIAWAIPSIEEMIAQFIGVDRKAFSDEKDAMLAAYREQMDDQP